MIKREKFIKDLESYYLHLTDRFEHGYEYLKNNIDNKNAIDLYNNIIDELKEVESLINYYKINK